MLVLIADAVSYPPGQSRSSCDTAVMASHGPDGSEFDDEQRRSLFGAHAAQYGDGRPGYPLEVFDHLRSACGLGPGTRVLEVGPGAGQATGPLLDAGADVMAVEVGDEFASMLRARFESRALDLVTGEFETVDVGSEPFDLVAAATSFHWIAPGPGIERAASLLRPGGSLALWWNHFGDPDRPDPFREAVQPVLQQHAPEFADSPITGGAGIGAHPYALDAETRLHEINSNPNFGPADQTVISWTTTQTALDIQRFLGSLSHWMTLDVNVRTDLLDAIGHLVDTRFGGAVDRPFLTAVYTARRL